jgi:DNA-binding NarL/FixJ family response regulator
VFPQVRDLSRREVEVMQAFLSPVSDYDNVSSELSITKKTLENHLVSIFSKLGVDNIKKAVWRFVLIYTEYLPKFLFFYVAPAAEAVNMTA